MQGTFQKPDIYYDFAKLIKSRGFPVVQPKYPSLNQTDPNLTSRTLADDAAVAEAAIRDIVECNKTAIVVMHSYGGLVGAEAVPEELTVSNRQAQGLPGGVAHLFYFTAFVMALGKSIYDSTGNSTQHDFFDGLFVIKDPVHKLYSDLPLPRAEHLAKKEVIPQSQAVLKTPMKRAAWRYLPSTFVKCTADQAILPPVQDVFAKMANSTVKSIDSGHSAFLSHPLEVIALLEQVAKSP